MSPQVKAALIAGIVTLLIAGVAGIWTLITNHSGNASLRKDSSAQAHKRYWELPEDSKRRLRRELAILPSSEIQILGLAGDRESRDLAIQLNAIFGEAGWKTNKVELPYQTQKRGITAVMPTNSTPSFRNFIDILANELKMDDSIAIQVSDTRESFVIFVGANY